MAPSTAVSTEALRSKSPEELPELSEILGEVPGVKVSAELQKSKSPEKLPEVSETSGDTNINGELVDPPRVKEDVAKFSAAAMQAMQILRLAIRPHLPLDRRPGKHLFKGIDLVTQSRPEKPFNDVGIFLMAAQLVKTWEKVVADDLKTKIAVIGHSPQTSSPSTSTRPVAKAQQLLQATRPHKPLSQPIAHAWTLPKQQRNFENHVVVGGGLLFVKENYLRRLELENLVYRQHLHDLEKAVYNKVHKDISKTVRTKPGQANSKAKAVIKPSLPAVKQKANGASFPHPDSFQKSPAKRSSNGGGDSGPTKRPKVGPHQSNPAKGHAAPNASVPPMEDHSGAGVSNAIVIVED